MGKRAPLVAPTIMAGREPTSDGSKSPPTTAATWLSTILEHFLLGRREGRHLSQDRFTRPRRWLIHNREGSRVPFQRSDGPDPSIPANTELLLQLARWVPTILHALFRSQVLPVLTHIRSSFLGVTLNLGESSCIPVLLHRTINKTKDCTNKNFIR